MPGFVPVPNTVRVNFDMDFNSEPVSCGYHFSRFSFSLTDLEALAGACQSAWADNIMPNVSAAVLFYAVGASGLNVENDIFVFNNIEPAVAGGQSSTSLPNDTAFAVTTTTGLRGRGYTGRLYIPGLVSSQRSDANHLEDGVANSLVDGITAVRLAGLGLGWTPVLVHSQANNVLLNPKTTTPIVGEEFKDLRLDTQVRRLPGR